jgi:hypothetical protein
LLTIATTPAKTLVGLAVKLRFIKRELDEGCSSEDLMDGAIRRRRAAGRRGGVSAAMLIDLAHAGKLPLRIANALIADSWHTVEDLAKLIMREFRTIPNVGPIGCQIVRDLLAERGFDVGHLEEKPAG